MVLVPVLFLINSSLRETNDFARNPIKLATSPHWANFSSVWANGAFATYLKNSLIITVGSTILILTLALGAGFVLGRYTFKGQNFIMGFILSGVSQVNP